MPTLKCLIAEGVGKSEGGPETLDKLIRGEGNKFFEI